MYLYLEGFCFLAVLEVLENLRNCKERSSHITKDLKNLNLESKNNIVLVWMFNNV